MNWEQELDKILQDEIFADVRAVQHKTSQASRLVESFAEITRFVEEHGRHPSPDGEFAEKKLALRLAGIMSDERKRQECLPHDTMGLLVEQEQDEENKETIGDNVACDLEEILKDPIFDEVQDVASDIFDLPEYMQRHIEERRAADLVAQREECKDFEVFKAGFEDINRKLRDRICRLTHFSEAHLQKGRYFVMYGQLVYVAEIDLDTRQRDHKNRANARTRCIIENGTEIALLQQSLMKALYTDGYTVVDTSELPQNQLEKDFCVTEKDVLTGYVYILRSLSEDPQIVQMKNLYKIGFTRTTVEERIRNAANEATYLFAKVEIVASWQIYNAKAVTVETLLHRLFADAQLQVYADIQKPAEWYVVPLAVATEAIESIVRGIPVAYDARLGRLIY